MRALLAALAAAALAASAPQAWAHTTVQAGPYEIEVGWGAEPPVAGLRNDVVIEVREPGPSEGVSTGVRNAFAGLEAVIRHGGESRRLDVATDQRPGHYYAPLIPTRAGTYSVSVSGDLAGTAVDAEIPVENVEGTHLLDFPARAGGAGGQDGAMEAVENLRRELDLLRAGGPAAADPGAAYDLSVLALSIGAAGAVLAVASMARRR